MGDEGDWWTIRNDPWLNVRREEPVGQSIRYVVYTEDRLQTFGGRVHDVHRQVTWSRRWGQMDR